MAAPPVQYAQTDDGMAIAYSEQGDGPPLIVSTGPMLPLEQGWGVGGVWSRLSESFRVVRFDPRGCGMSTRQDAFGSYYDEAQDLLAVVRELDVPRMPVLGYYLGTPSAVIACIEDPERFSHLILHQPIPLRGQNSPSTSNVPEDLGDQMISTLLRMGWQYHFEPARRALLLLLAPDADMDTLRLMAESMHHYPSTERLLQVLPELRSLNLAEDIHAITASTLVSVTPEDARTGIGRIWAQSIRGARLSMLRSEGWVLEDGNPLIEELAQSMEEFIRPAPRAAMPISATRTVLFTDIEGSTSLLQRLGNLGSRQITREVEEMTRSSLRKHGGNEVKTMGDGVMAWFTMASAGLDAAIDLQRSLAMRHNELGVRVRIGLSAGEPIEEGDDLYGATVNQAARIMSLAQGGEIFVSNIVRGLVQGHEYRFEDMGARQLRGFDESSHLYQLDWQAS